MNSELPKPTMSYVFPPARTLREACRQAGGDKGGERCPTCPSNIYARTTSALVRSLVK